MSEMKNRADGKITATEGVDELFQAAFGGETCEDCGGEHGAVEAHIDALRESLERAADEGAAERKRRLEREAKDALMVGGLCALGVVSLIAAAVSGVWLPVAVGLGVCLSGAAGALICHGMAVMRG